MPFNLDLLVNFTFNIFFGLSFGYFYAHFLSCERPIRAMIEFLLFYSLILGPFSMLVQRYLLLKTIIMCGGCLCFLRFMYRKDSWFRITIAFLIHMTVTVSVEFLSLSLCYLCMGELYDFSYRYVIPGSVYIVQVILYFSGFTICIRLFAKKQFDANRIGICQFCLCMTQAGIGFYLCYCFFMARSLEKSYMDIVIIGILLVSSALLYNCLIRSCRIEQQERSIRSLQKIYARQPQLYLSVSDSEQNYQELRHDLINFLLSVQTDQRKRKQDANHRIERKEEI